MNPTYFNKTLQLMQQEYVRLYESTLDQFKEETLEPEFYEYFEEIESSIQNFLDYLSEREYRYQSFRDARREEDEN